MANQQRKKKENAIKLLKLSNPIIISIIDLNYYNDNGRKEKKNNITLRK